MTERPSPEALAAIAAAAQTWFRRDTDRAVQPPKAAGELWRDMALALDRFRAAGVEAERERCAAACNPLIYGMAGEEIRSRIVRGWTP